LLPLDTLLFHPLSLFASCGSNILIMQQWRIRTYLSKWTLTVENETWMAGT
jgi:hypothetical protein